MNLENGSGRAYNIYLKTKRHLTGSTEQEGDAYKFDTVAVPYNGERRSFRTIHKGLDNHNTDRIHQLFI